MYCLERSEKMDKSEIYRILNDAYFPETCDEKEVLEYLPTVLHNCQVFVDVGASLGQYTFFANKYLRGGEIFAIEADPIRFEELKRNCEKWESSSGNALTAIHAAVSDNDGQTTFYTTRSNVSGGLFKHDIAHQAVEWSECIVDCITLDTLFKDSSPDFVKIDVEGSEFQVLSGARRILSEGKARFLVEMHPIFR